MCCGIKGYNIFPIDLLISNFMETYNIILESIQNSFL